jgi:Rrf2 family protein
VHVSEAASLAMHSAAMLTRADQPLTAREMAQRTGASQAHLAKVLQKLVHAGLLQATRGPAGGYLLAAPPTEVSLLQVYEAVEGSLPQPRCLLPHGRCQFDTCIFGHTLERVRAELRAYLEEHTLADIAR